MTYFAGLTGKSFVARRQDVSFLVHQFNFVFVILSGFKSDQLRSVCHYLSHSEAFELKVNVLCLLQTVQPLGLSQAIHLFQHRSSQLSVSGQSFVIAFDALSFREAQKFVFIGDSDKQHEIFCGFSVAKDLSDELGFHVNIFHFVRGDVLSLLQLEDVFLSVNNFKGIVVMQHLAHVSSLEPAVTCDTFLSHLLESIVPQKDLRSPDPNLPSRR